MKKVLTRTVNGFQTGGKTNLKSAYACDSWLDRIFGEKGTKATFSDDPYAYDTGSYDRREVPVFTNNDGDTIAVLDGVSVVIDGDLLNVLATKGTIANGIYFLWTRAGVAVKGSDLDSEAFTIETALDVLGGITEFASTAVRDAITSLEEVVTRLHDKANR